MPNHLHTGDPKLWQTPVTNATFPGIAATPSDVVGSLWFNTAQNQMMINTGTYTGGNWTISQTTHPTTATLTLQGFDLAQFSADELMMFKAHVEANPDLFLNLSRRMELILKNPSVKDAWDQFMTISALAMSDLKDDNEKQ